MFESALMADLAPPGRSHDASEHEVYARDVVALGALVVDDGQGIELALRCARQAEALDEVPVGAIVVLDGRVIGRGWNRTRFECDPTAHAELRAIAEAARHAGAMRLPGAVVYTNLEPCFMCAGALVHARVARVVWSVRDPKFGGARSLGNVLDDPRSNHRIEITEGVGAEASRALLQQFFQKKRERADGR